ncbi:MBL fold metallo-hydrolase [Blastococcus sp. VKM Ac-2987]|uniref:MBL fold metallo-hydrolase n=1 Tax=Blastococcus sp. VKM Ac-2987 TaxID=3004141 RepID=UPI0022AB749E|nr:MBL fold metallo-hydrolase [Blastococcus sp. VKM Ac-2987]MCZ2860615.1 MBL fold metallo-hydrolase [Blastococcus sp. VKM Ac-2987]
MDADVVEATVHRTAPVLVAPDVHRLTLGPGPLASNVYLVGTRSSWALVDAGWPGSAGAIRGAAEQLFGAGTRPEAVLLTHLHPDHSGAAGELARSWGVPVLVHPAEQPMAAGVYRPEFAMPLDRWVVVPFMRLLPAAVRRRAEDAGNITDVVRSLDPAADPPGLPGWDVVATPGHTPGHVAFRRRSDGLVITGDALLTVDLNSPRGWLGGRPRLGGPWWFTTWDRAAARRSIEAVAALRPSVLATGHGPVRGLDTDEPLRELAARTRVRGPASGGFLRPVTYAGEGRYRPPPRTYTRFQWLGFVLTALGLSPGFVVTLEVPGRRTGRIRRTNLVRTDLEGQCYLVALAGESEWVRNVRAAGGRVVLGRRHRCAATLVEVPVEERPPVLHAYLHRPGRAPGSRAILREARAYFGVDGDPTPDQLAAVADRHPVFRVLPAPPASS